MFEFMVDIAGPFRPGIDFDWSYTYFVAYSIRVPLKPDTAWATPPPEPELPEGSDESDLPFVLPSDAMQGCKAPRAKSGRKPIGEDFLI